MPRRHSDELVYQEGDNFVDVEIPVLRMEAETDTRNRDIYHQYLQRLMDGQRRYSHLLSDANWLPSYEKLEPSILFKNGVYRLFFSHGNGRVFLQATRLFYRRWYNFPDGHPAHESRSGGFGVVSQPASFKTPGEALAKYMELRYQDKESAPMAFEPYMEDGEALCLHDVIFDWLQLRSFDHILEISGES